MQPNKGMAKVLVVIVIVLVCTSIGAAFFLFTDTPDPIPTDEVITRALVTDERSSKVIPSAVRITKATERFARGTLVDETDGLTKNFFALRIGDVWRIVDVTNITISCERFARLGFPDDFIADCVLSFSDAVTVAEIDATLDAMLLSGSQLRVIGFVTEVSEGVDGSLVTVSSGGETETFTIANANTSVGDVIVVTIEAISNPNQGNVSETNTATPSGIVVTQTATVGSEDFDLVGSTNSSQLPQETGTNTGTTDSSSNTINVSGSSKTTIYKINAPNAAPPKNYFLNAGDIDTSFEDIKIEGSF